MSVRQRKLVARLAGLAVPLVAATLLSAESPAHGAPASGRALSAEARVRLVLTEQQSAWNRGDVDGFLAGYWNSGQTVFAGTQGITRGWQALRERYRRTYPDRRAMGTLAFSDLEVTVLCPDAALALGKWHLDRDSGPLGGVFSLVLRKFPEGWRIIADHTSVVPENQPPRAR
jgi:hypothetical protein